jgi:membrane-associated protease RseP (regulator of RpoE activity)
LREKSTHVLKHLPNTILLARPNGKSTIFVSMHDNLLENNPPNSSIQPKFQLFRRYGIHLLLFALTFITTTMAGAEHRTNKSWSTWFSSIDPRTPPDWNDWLMGLTYSLSFLAFLTAHEFGHYFTAVYHRVRCSLPYYLPFMLPIVNVPILNIGTFGAVIRIRQEPESTIKYFDIGIAGPLAGFVVSLILLTIGFGLLPPLEYLFEMNPQYLRDFGYVPTETEILDKYAVGFQSFPRVGHSLLYTFFEHFIADPNRLPNHLEIMHYPFLFVGFLTLFFTALNLLPIGQLDGGHVIYGLFGRQVAGVVSRVTVIGLLIIGGLGILDNFRVGDLNWWAGTGVYLAFLYYLCLSMAGRRAYGSAFGLVVIILAVQGLVQWVWPSVEPYPLWLLYSVLAVKMIGVDHPPAWEEVPLDWKRKCLGVLALVIFVLCFTPYPLTFADNRTGKAPVQVVMSLNKN